MFLKKYTRLTALYMLFFVASGVCMERPNDGGRSTIPKEFSIPPTASPAEQFLFASVQNRLLDQVKLALEKSASVNICDEEGLTPLHMAVRNGDTAIARLLLGRGANVNVATTHGITSLHYAATLSDKDDKETILLRELIVHGARLEARTALCQTPLMWAILANQLNAVKILLNCGADLRARQSPSVTCAQCLAGQSNECVKGASPLHLACSKTNNDFVFELLAYGAECDKDPLIKSALTDLQLFKLLARAPEMRGAVKVDIFSDRDLLMAIGRGEIDKVIFLLGYGTSAEIGLNHAKNILHRALRMNAPAAAINRFRYIRDLLAERIPTDIRDRDTNPQPMQHARIRRTGTFKRTASQDFGTTNGFADK